MISEQRLKVRDQEGFVAALDQSGGSTPKALRLYGLPEREYSGDAEMFDKVHEMRTRIMTSPSFGGDRIIGAILFENTMDREVRGKPTAQYLWKDKRIVPFLKVDRGLASEKDAARVMNPIPGLDDLLGRAKQAGIFGTKMRSFITGANAAGVQAIVSQQFEIGRRILETGLVPILEPEIDIHSSEKAEAEALLRDRLVEELNELAPGQEVMLKLTLPDGDNFYAECVKHPSVLRVVALSGGYPREDANARLARNKGVVASFSRALTEGLTAQQTDQEFHAALDASIESIFQASKA